MSAIHFSLIFLLAAASAMGGFKVPTWVYPIQKIQEAQTIAAKQNKPLAFVYTEAGST